MDHTPYSDMSLPQILLLRENYRIFRLLPEKQQEEVIKEIIDQSTR